MVKKDFVCTCVFVFNYLWSKTKD